MYLEVKGAIDIVLLGFGDLNHPKWRVSYLRGMYLGYSTGLSMKELGYSIIFIS
jgi:hypothetical protein